MTLLPFLLQWSLGGYVASSAVSLWAIVAAFGTLFFFSVDASIPWFLAFVVLTLFSGVIDPALARNAAPLPDPIRVAFFVLNVIGDVQDEEGVPDGIWYRCSVPRQRWIDHPGEEREHDECEKPWYRRINAKEEQRAERGDDGPETDGARGDIPAQTPLQKEGQQRHEQCLGESEEPVALRSRKDSQAGERHHLIREWDRRRLGETEGPVRPNPDDCEGRDDAGSEGERDLLGARLVGIAVGYAQQREPLDEPREIRATIHRASMPLRPPQADVRFDLLSTRSERPDTGARDSAHKDSDKGSGVLPDSWLFLP